jgi:hypothetical protein
MLLNFIMHQIKYSLKQKSLQDERAGKKRRSDMKIRSNNETNEEETVTKTELWVLLYSLSNDRYNPSTHSVFFLLI